MAPVVGGGPVSAVHPPTALGMLSMGGGDEQEGGFGQKALADSLKLAVEKGHLDISLLSLPHIPPNVLDLLTEILTVIPRLDGYEEELKKLVCFFSLSLFLYVSFSLFSLVRFISLSRDTVFWAIIRIGEHLFTWKKKLCYKSNN